MFEISLNSFNIKMILNRIWKDSLTKECGVNNIHKPIRSLVSAAVIGIMATTVAHAGGFSLYTESSAYMTGNFAAGAAAEAYDASTGWYNPAGLALIHEQQAVFGGVGVFPSAKLSGRSRFAVAPPIPAYVETFSDINGAQNALVPSFHYALPIGENAAFGLSMVSPFGLSTDWGVYSPVRYQATFTELLTTNLSPEIGGKVSENFAIGAGIDLQFARVKFNRMLGLAPIGALPPPFGPGNPFFTDSLSYNKGRSYGVGFHAGVMGMFNDNHTRLGLNYQSEMRHNFSGYSQLTGPLANPFALGPVPVPATSTFRSDNLTSNLVKLPSVTTLSAYHDVNETVALLGSVVYTGWGVLKTIQLNNVAAGVPNPLTGLIDQVVVNSASPQNYSDAWRASIGANYKINPQWMLRVGGGYDETPTNNIDRDVRLPDTSRWALAVGAHYQMRPDIGVDFGWTHLFAADDIAVNRTDALGATSSYNVLATGKAYANLIGAQMVWIMDPPAPPVATK